jgi:cytochrome c oxidase assembly protein Cox11
VRFAALGVAEDKAERVDDTAEYKRLYWLMDAVKKELKSRPGDQRRALLTLYDHPNMQVRLMAAKSTLAVAPDEARRMVEWIAASRWFPQAGDAGMCLARLDSGDFVPK